MAKIEAVRISKECNLHLQQYSDEDLYLPGNEHLIQYAVENDFESDDPHENAIISENVITNEEAIIINEDISNINLIKQKSSGIPTYVESVSRSSETRNYNNNAGRSSFIRYKDAFIRKTTALYLLQEKNQLSNDRLLRVRATQPKHIFNIDRQNQCGRQEIVQSGELCAFKLADSNKISLGRVIQFSYLEGTKKQRQYSSCYVDVTLESVNSIGVFANWFQARKKSANVVFVPLDIFTIGYHPMQNYVSTIDESLLDDVEDGAFSMTTKVLEQIFPLWENVLYFEGDIL